MLTNKEHKSRVKVKKILEVAMNYNVFPHIITTSQMNKGIKKLNKVILNMKQQSIPHALIYLAINAYSHKLETVFQRRQFYILQVFSKFFKECDFIFLLKWRYYLTRETSPTIKPPWEFGLHFGSVLTINCTK